MITKDTIDFSNSNFSEGEVILIDKALRKTSFDVVYKIRKSLNVKKVGHAGTLDPCATGLLILCTGKKTKEIDCYQGMTKTYTGVITLGKTTPSMDSETDAAEEKNISGISEKEILNAREKFIGSIQQLPPMYSAIKFKGKSLYKYARKGVEINRAFREINIFVFEILKLTLPDVYFKVLCSKGTYIRVLAHDFGQELGCGAYLSELRRTHIGEFSVDNALKIEEFLSRTHSAVNS